MKLLLKLLLTAQYLSVIKCYYFYPFGQQCDNLIPSVTTVTGPLAPTGVIRPGQLIFEDNFDTFNLNTWRHSLTLSGKGVSILYKKNKINHSVIILLPKAFEFQWYHNNRSNSFVENGILYMRPTLVAEIFGDSFLTQGTLNIHGASPNAQ